MNVQVVYQKGLAVGNTWCIIVSTNVCNVRRLVSSHSSILHEHEGGREGVRA